MYRVESRRDEGRLGSFLVVSIVLHALVLILYPQWEQSPIAGTLPGEGVFQFTLRQPTEASTFSLQRVTPRQSVPQPQSRPVPVQPVQQPQQQVQVTERPEPSQTQLVQAPAPRPDVNPAPRQTQIAAGEPVQLPTAVCDAFGTARGAAHRSDGPVFDHVGDGSRTRGIAAGRKRRGRR